MTDPFGEGAVEALRVATSSEDAVSAAHRVLHGINAGAHTTKSVDLQK